VFKAKGKRQKAKVVVAPVHPRRPTFAFCLLPFAFTFLSCHRETRAIAPSAQDAARPLPISSARNNPYEGNAYAISQGQQLFDKYNCSGCHFHGGGGIGPALMDEEWTYGSSPAQIYVSIAEGRPNGMPSWGGHIPDYQIWQLVTYVRSVGGFEGKVATPSRAEGMQAKR
jgi:cytochrome c oxidase cbb3-type subunit III